MTSTAYLHNSVSNIDQNVAFRTPKTDNDGIRSHLEPIFGSFDVSFFTRLMSTASKMSLSASDSSMHLSDSVIEVDTIRSCLRATSASTEILTFDLKQVAGNASRPSPVRLPKKVHGDQMSIMMYPMSHANILLTYREFDILHCIIIYVDIIDGFCVNGVNEYVTRETVKRSSSLKNLNSSKYNIRFLVHTASRSPRRVEQKFSLCCEVLTGSLIYFLYM